MADSSTYAHNFSYCKNFLSSSLASLSFLVGVMQMTIPRVPCAVRQKKSKRSKTPEAPRTPTACMNYPQSQTPSQLPKPTTQPAIPSSLPPSTTSRGKTGKRPLANTRRIPKSTPGTAALTSHSSVAANKDIAQAGTAVQSGGLECEAVVAVFLRQQFENHVRAGTEPPIWVQELAMNPANVSVQVAQVRELLCQ